MTKPIANWNDAYDPQAFAERHGLTLDQARIIISSNGPSRHACDVGALAFLRALEIKKRREAAKAALLAAYRRTRASAREPG
ncbi:MULTISPECIES: hypothetical protein [unclassified Mesorhizobium]|uniref:hypothetical protein n=1 Tax=unclassified Mesorhizobium TaxID=325217 RepID=UPI000BB04EB4|nr:MULTISPECIES: hypothetical protein [unclassified Mesorhizobium]AZO09442.1 hypothetical protein EJ074_10120 [Mesorhizobium sp. M3A.F.Ca.ET.080.04.2.1]PBB84908.1 hypothetical protein CK216_20365 [Mesorhizobium sp. WSM3876]TGT54370.1 hypothetical protein EN813_043090 [Mesorhizobium sp. M00.F.Ca.ET.170.01.1.1]RWB67957.1 MAG: hypothetical protein EOQ49_24090 [Mesorhizobium sp.]RWB87713.1 MAG: hypothetical protein EOQ52_16115 [Mesorhizobium sp.]